MLFMSVTWEVSKLVNGWLKAEAEANMLFMVVTLEVIHPEISGLHVDLSSKRLAMLVTQETSQVVMLPSVDSAAVWLTHQRSTAGWSSVDAKQRGVGAPVGEAEGVAVGAGVKTAEKETANQ